MAVQLDAQTRVVVFSTDPAVRRKFFDLLNQSGIAVSATDPAFPDEGEIGSEASLILAVGPAEHGSDQTEFERCLDLLRGFRLRHASGYSILLCGGRLSLEQSCRAVTAGVNGIINLHARDCSHRLAEHLQIARTLIQNTQTANPERTPSDDGLVGRSQAFRQVLAQAGRAALVSDAPVIISGESGTGKQKLAEIVHQLDPKRKNKPFICVNCAAIAGTLAESELFGHRKGAFTGATEDRLGYFRSAEGGTILLDEISELSLALQPKILRVLQEGLVLPVGSDREHRIEVRVIAATNRDLKEMVHAGQFRLDLFQRLNVIRIEMPPLRERVEDIPDLFAAFLRKYAHYSRCRIETVDPEVFEILARRVGSGNIRELENMVRQILVFKQSGSRIELTDLPLEMLEIPSTSAAQVRLNVPDDMIEDLAQGRRRLADALDDG